MLVISLATRVNCNGQHVALTPSLLRKATRDDPGAGISRSRRLEKFISYKFLICWRDAAQKTARGKKVQWQICRFMELKSKWIY